MILVILLTCILVNIDAFLCAFAVAFNTRLKFLKILLSSIIGFTLCLIAALFAINFKNDMNLNLDILCGVLLILIGVYNFFKLKKDAKVTNSGEYFNYISVGFTSGIDMAVGAFSLCLIYNLVFVIPIIFAVGQYVSILLGFLLSKNNIFKPLLKHSYFSGLLLAGIGIFKILGLI